MRSFDGLCRVLGGRRVGCCDVLGAVGGQGGVYLDGQSYLEKQCQAPWLELAWVARARLTVRVARSRRKNCTRSSSRVMPRPGPSGTVSWHALQSSGSARISSVSSSGPNSSVPHCRLANVANTSAEIKIGRAHV